ncbi:MAG: serine/threonine protein kinase, partial [Planctomycetota bacterium]
MAELRQLGDFVLERKIGQGGMGEVYLAHQVSLDRTVAVKVLPRSLASQENFIERFQREAKAAANLIHPNVIQIYSIGVEQGTPYFAMEYVEGEDLAQRLKRQGRLGYEEAVDIVAGVANALACAYEKNIVHRDIKPSNIMIDKNGVVKVMDFGLAKATHGQEGLNLTQSGMIMGTPNYMSPEQARGEPLDCRSDIYSLGVVFYELLAGRLPFVADTPAALIYKHAYEDPPPIEQINPDVPPFLAEIVTRMLAKDPAARYQNPKALLLDLNEFRRNANYYLRGGRRRLPVVDGAPVTEPDRTAPMAASPGAGVSTTRFKDADTMAETRHDEPQGGESTQDLPAGGGGRRLVLVLVLLGALGGVAWWGWPRIAPLLHGSGAGGSGEGGSAARAGEGVLDLASLGRRLPAGVKVFLQQGIDRKELPFSDLRLPVGRYVLIFQRRGFRDITRDVQVTEKGTVPPLGQMEFRFEPTAELQRLFARAQRALEQRRYGKAVELLETIDQEAPDYPGLSVLLSEARKRYAELDTTFKKGQRLILERRWQEAIDTLKRLPDSYEKHFEALQLASAAEAKLSTLANLRKGFEDQLAEGEFRAAGLTLDQMAELLPEHTDELARARQRLATAQKLYADAVGEYENAQLSEARRLLEKLLEIAPRHAEARRLLAEVRNRLAALQGEAAQREAALTAAREALRAGDPVAALEAAERARRLAPEDAEVRAVWREARTARAKAEIADALAQLDRSLQQRKAYNVLERVDPAASELRARLERQLERWFAEPIVLAQAEHTDLSVELPDEGPADRARVECEWRLELRFPAVADAQPPVRGVRTRLRLRQ